MVLGGRGGSQCSFMGPPRFSWGRGGGAASQRASMCHTGPFLGPPNVLRGGGAPSVLIGPICPFFKGGGPPSAFIGPLSPGRGEGVRCPHLPSMDPLVPRGGSPSAPIGPLCPGGGGSLTSSPDPRLGGGPFAGSRHPGWEGGGCGPPRLSGGKRGGGGVGGTSKELRFEAIHRGLRGGGGGTGVPSRECRERGGPYTRVVEWGWGRVLLCPGGYGPKGCRGGSPPGTMVMVLGGVRRGMSSGALRSANV